MYNFSVNSLGQNENSQTQIVIDSALCEICAPSLMSPVSSPDHQEEMQDAESTRRRTSRSRKVISSSEDDTKMPMSRSRTASKLSKRGQASSKRGSRAKSARSRSTSRKSGGRATSRSKSRTRKSSTSRRGRRA